MGFTNASTIVAAVVVVVVVMLVLVVAAASSSPAELSPIIVAAVVLVLVGAMDGRAAFSDPRPPVVSSSFSLRFSLRACDFEYGARDASNRSMKSSCLRIRLSFLFGTCCGDVSSSAFTECNISSAETSLSAPTSTCCTALSWAANMRFTAFTDVV